MTLPQSHKVSMGFFNPEVGVYKKEKPYVCLVPLTHAPPGFSQSNVEYHDKDVEVYDARGYESDFQLDVHGFQFIKHDPKDFEAWQQGQKVVKEYYPHIIELLKAQLGADTVQIYDHTTRLGDHVETPQRNRNVQGAPSISAHVDHTLDSAVRQVKEDIAEASELLKGRFQIINVWHPIVEPMEQHPLALCDYRTSKHDGYESDLVYPHFDSENLQVAHSKGQRWYFADKMMKNEAWFIKMADSAGGRNGISEFSPHTSFRVPWARKDCPPRESIEFRAYVFYKPDQSSSTP